MVHTLEAGTLVDWPRHCGCIRLWTLWHWFPHPGDQASANRWGVLMGIKNSQRCGRFCNELQLLLIERGRHLPWLLQFVRRPLLYGAVGNDMQHAVRTPVAGS